MRSVTGLVLMSGLIGLLLSNVASSPMVVRELPDAGSAAANYS